MLMPCIGQLVTQAHGVFHADECGGVGERFAPLGNEEKRALSDCARSVRKYATREILIKDGFPTDGINLILSGIACRYKVLPDGRRQIVAYYLLPGDTCDLRISLLKRMDHARSTRERCRLRPELSSSRWREPQAGIWPATADGYLGSPLIRHAAPDKNRRVGGWDC